MQAEWETLCWPSEALPRSLVTFRVGYWEWEAPLWRLLLLWRNLALLADLRSNFRLMPQRLVQRVQALFQNVWFRTAIRAVIIVGCAAYLWSVFRQLLAAPIPTFYPNYILGALALFVSFTTVLFSILPWSLLLKTVRSPAGLIQTANAHLVPNVAKYLPGYAWQFAGKAYLTNQLGLPARRVGWVMSVEFVAYLLMGVEVALWTTPTTLLVQWFGSLVRDAYLNWFRVGLIIVFLGILLVLPYLIGLFWERDWIKSFRAGYYLFFLLSVGILWLLSGAAFWLLAQALQPLPWSSYPLFLCALSIALTVGILVLFAPAGAGVREAMMVFILSGFISAPHALVLAILSRIATIASELAGALLVMWLNDRRLRLGVNIAGGNLPDKPA